METKHQLKIPTLLCKPKVFHSLIFIIILSFFIIIFFIIIFLGDTPAMSPGYKFSTETEKRASYHYMLETTNQLTSNGSQLEMEEWLVILFFL